MQPIPCEGYSGRDSAKYIHAVYLLGHSFSKRPPQHILIILYNKVPLSLKPTRELPGGGPCYKFALSPKLFSAVLLVVIPAEMEHQQCASSNGFNFCPTLFFGTPPFGPQADKADPRSGRRRRRPLPLPHRRSLRTVKDPILFLMVRSACFSTGAVE